MPRPGVLMRIVEPKIPGSLLETDPLSLDGTDAIYQLEATDGQRPSQNTLYFLSDVSSVLRNEQSYQNDVQSHENSLVSISWVIASLISGQPRIEDNHQVPDVPLGVEVVVNGSTPKVDKEGDYHAWYDQEHVGKLGLVPGWRAMRRYKLEAGFGDVETASFYGVNFYDQVNGLGGPEWKAGVTDWTLRIRDQAAKPNVRRTWRLMGVSNAA
ncbi:hypothetical protein B0A48_13218 [Cryoendolithus antarcticus]|uniref:Uncharacterized protein n=1 Tax=Cryoendolithus antarcticus TaxID=1507870 RepID=A0A1V8SNI0_9PEZI|nr:hypothetical protein B0A48_13218 [Cryoendolithus antarcticus]